MSEVTNDWFIMVWRQTYKGVEMPPYVVGPYPDAKSCEGATQSESSLPFCLMTIDAKAEKYVAYDCTWGQNPPKNGELIEPSPEDIQSGYETYKLLDMASWKTVKEMT